MRGVITTRRIHGLTVIVMSVLLASCATFDRHRHDVNAICDRDRFPAERASPACRSAVVEHTNGVDVAYVEFTDQGLLYDRRQLARALALLREKEDQDLQVVVFVHGWKHSAESDDLDVGKFRARVLPAFVRQRPSVRTVGVYVGWRGKSLRPTGFVQNLSFYDRKATADHVARGSVRELFSHLRALGHPRTPGAGREVSVTLIGHSFGGLILYNAFAESLLDSLIAANNGNRSSPRLARPVVDAVILLNPAFEATRFEPLFQAAQEFLESKSEPPWRYGQGQRPVFVSITSETDSATKTWFRFGRAVNSIFEHEGWTDQDHDRTDYAKRLEKLANTHTIGHMERYRTHRLALVRPPDQAAGSNRGAEPIACSGVANRLLAGETRFPLWNMYADANVIDGHHDIYGENLWELVARLSDRRIDVDHICP